MNERFGPFSAFFTTNFADTYHVLTQVLAQGAFEPLGWRPLNMLQDSPPMPTSQEMHKIVATRPMVQAKLFMHLDALTHQHLLCVRRTFLGRQKYDPCSKWIDEPAVEDDFASNGDFGLAAFLRAIIKALEAQGRGFAHGHEKLHGEPRTKAIDIIQLFLGCHGTGAPEHRPAAKHIAEKTLTAWMDAHRKACLRDAATKQYDSAVESAKQFGCTELQEVFTAEEKKRCRLDGGEDEGGTQRLPNVEVVPAPEPAHVLREKRQAADEGRAMKHPYRGMPLTGAPAARFPKYLWAKHFNGYEDLDENGHATETLDFGAPEHDAGCHTGWIDHTDCYIIDGDRQVQGFRKTDGSMATEEELQAEARRYSANWSADTRFCHVFNHSHECKPTCFKNTEYKKPSADEAPKQRAACRFRFWRLVSIAERWWRRMGKALVAEPTVSAADDADNEFGRCKVRRGNCFRGSSQDLCQACLRCNVDYQYQHRTFPEREIDEQEIADGAAYQKPHQNLPGILGWLARRGSAANGKTVELLLQSFAIAARASAVADFYATKYLAKPQQWLASALGPLISGYRKKEEEQNQMEEKPSVQKMSLQKLRTAIFAANRSVWISSCEACLFLETGGSAVLSHPDVAVHGRKGLFMMNECKRILNREVAGEGLWQTDLSKCQGQQEGEVLEIQPADEEENISEIDEEDGEVVELAGATEDPEAEHKTNNSDAGGMVLKFLQFTRQQEMSVRAQARAIRDTWAGLQGPSMSTEAHSPRGSPIAPDVGLDRSGPDEHADTVRAVRIILAARPWVADAIAVLEAEDPRPSISFNSPGDGSSGDEQAEIDEINRAAAAWAEAERFLYGPGTQAEDDMIDALRELISCVSSPPEDAGDMHILDTVEAVFALQPDLGRRIQAPHPVVPDVPLQGNGAENTTSMAGATEHGGDENNAMDLKKSKRADLPDHDLIARRLAAPRRRAARYGPSDLCGIRRARGEAYTWCRYAEGVGTPYVCVCCALQACAGIHAGAEAGPSETSGAFQRTQLHARECQ
jgi:hypothetical protein